MDAKEKERIERIKKYFKEQEKRSKSLRVINITTKTTPKKTK